MPAHYAPIPYPKKCERSGERQCRSRWFRGSFDAQGGLGEGVENLTEATWIDSDPEAA
jgi:hypothetical protein